MANGIGIGVSVNKARNGVAGDIGTLATFAKAPTEFVATVLGNDTAFAFFPTTTAIPRLPDRRERAA